MQSNPAQPHPIRPSKALKGDSEAPTLWARWNLGCPDRQGAGDGRAPLDEIREGMYTHCFGAIRTSPGGLTLPSQSPRVPLGSARTASRRGRRPHMQVCTFVGRPSLALEAPSRAHDFPPQTAPYGR